MRLLHMLGHGLGDLRAHPGRAALSGVSLCIGVLAVVAIFTIGAITAEVFVAVNEQRDGRYFTAQGTVTVDDPGASQVRAALAAAEGVDVTGGAVAILARPVGLTGMAWPDQWRRGEPLRIQPLTYVAGNLGGVRRLPLLAGRWFDAQADLPVELVVNQIAASRWGGIGTELMVLHNPDEPPVSAVIVGIIADGTGDSTVLVSLPALLFARPSAIAGAEVELWLHHPRFGLPTLSPVARNMAVALGGQLHDGLRRHDTLQQLIDQLRSQQLAFLLVAIVALVISALGILNIGLASVGERSRELVIRRAVGATRVDLLGQVLTSALLVGIFAAVTAITIAAIGVEWWVPHRISPASAIEPPHLPWAAAVWGVIAAASTTLLGAAIPAAVAARLDVATALRD